MSTGLLARIDSPADVKGLRLEQLAELAQELRDDIVRVTSTNGGHLATNLGTIELPVALHYVLDSPRDKIIWDVGNQCYAHKMLTGRRERFATIRQQDGLSGFVNRVESPHDHVTSGHAGTALSTALGIASARDQFGDDYRVAAVVGDGSMSSGLSFEALNNLGTFGSQLLLILNDNGFSISPSGGALSRTLRRAQASILDGTVFAQLGLEYLGPVDGHDLPLLIEVLRDAARIERPVVLHVVTQKGKGYPPAERDPMRFHGVSPFDPASGKSKPSGATSYSQVFGEELVRIADEDARVVAITAAMPAGTGLSGFAERFPDRFFDVGIAEQHAVTFAGGLAIGGSRPVVAIYSTFLQRGYDQVIHDVCLQDLPVTFVLDRAGVVGADGPTHHGVFDLSFLRAIPRMVLMAPKDGEEFKKMLRLAVAHDSPTAIRIPRGAVAPPRKSRESTSLRIGRGEVLREGDNVGLLALGSMVHRALEAAEVLEQRGLTARVVNARFVKPLDASLILETANRVERLFVLEEHARAGGFGSAVLELLADHQISTPVTLLGLPDRFLDHGSTDELLDDCGLSEDKIVSCVLKAMDAEGRFNSRFVPRVDKTRQHQAIKGLCERALPAELAEWVGEYDKIGHRDPFLWKWVMGGLRLTSLACVDSELREANLVTKALGVMFDVLLDDVADRSGGSDFLEHLLAIPFSQEPGQTWRRSSEQRVYAEATRRVWEEICSRARGYPRFEEFAELLRFDYLQLINAMRYSHLVNRAPQLLNISEHDLYLPHNMHMMISGTLDLMCSSGFDSSELGAIREVIWNAQCMGRIGNLVSTWERELGDQDFTSGVFAYAVGKEILSAEELVEADPEWLRTVIASHDCETFFLRRWHHHRTQIAQRADSIQSLDVQRLVFGLEQLLEIHLGSRGRK